MACSTRPNRAPSSGICPAFSETSSAGGVLNVRAAGESGIFSSVREGIEAGGHPVGSDGLQTFGGVRAVARYVQIEVVPSSGGMIVINKARFQTCAMVNVGCSGQNSLDGRDFVTEENCQLLLKAGYLCYAVELLIMLSVHLLFRVIFRV